MAQRPGAELPPSRARYLIGCWFAIVGFFAGGMIGVAVAKVIGQLKRCAPAEGFPACDFQMYLWVGGFAGALLLPAAIVWRLWQSDAARRRAQRG